MLVLLAAGLSAALQAGAYFQIRRQAVFDKQEAFHVGAFHVVTLVELPPEQELLAAIDAFVDATEDQGARVIYAGKMIEGMVSAQLPDATWGAFVLAEFASRDAYDEAAPALRAARDRFANSYAIGLDRPILSNLLIPAGLLALRVGDLATGEPRRIPFRRADPSTKAPETQAVFDRLEAALLAESRYGERALVVLNLMQDGGAAEQEANAAYGLEMLKLMAEARCGPMHMGDAVALDGEAAANFDSIAIVYYPGVQFFADMLQSEFYGAIVGDKQLGDTLSAPTVPLLPHLPR